jgi:hypothetical protein
MKIIFFIFILISLQTIFSFINPGSFSTQNTTKFTDNWTFNSNLNNWTIKKSTSELLKPISFKSTGLSRELTKFQKKLPFNSAKFMGFVKLIIIIVEIYIK